jgi:hypothetical protein
MEGAGAHHKAIRDVHLCRWFAEDAKRSERFTAEAIGIFVDSSKNHITDETLKLPIELAKESGLRERMWSVSADSTVMWVGVGCLVSLTGK